MKHALHTYPGYQELIRAVADEIVARMNSAAKARGRASLVLSGGSTPKGVYELLGSVGYRSRIAWDKVHFFWGDERCVPPSSPESNFRMAQESLVAKIPIPAENVHRIAGEQRPTEAARAYEMEIQNFFSLEPGEFPAFDFILLGIGGDGHTASLFPGTTALHVTDRIVTEVYVEKIKAHRITMTFPTINNSRSICFVVEGKNKAVVLREIREDTGNAYPAQGVHPVAGELLWFVDSAAASELQTITQS